MEQQYDYTEWSDWRLDKELTSLLESKLVPHNPERRAKLNRDMLHLLFEMGSRDVQS